MDYVVFGQSIYLEFVRSVCISTVQVGQTDLKIMLVIVQSSTRARRVRCSISHQWPAIQEL